MFRPVLTGRAVSAAMTLFAMAAPAAFSQSAPNVYVQHNLVSDIAGVADVTDPNLANPWGISISTTSPFWVSDGGTGKSTLYNGSGAITALVVTIPAGTKGPAVSVPTGQVQNASTGFLLANGVKASFIFATLDGTISAWNGGTISTIFVDNSAAGASYTGLALDPATPRLYAANFASGKIDVFDTKFAPTTVAGGFVDPTLPGGYNPFNIWNLGGKLYVAYAKQGSNGNPGAGGTGYVDVFDTNGNFLSRAASGSPLNGPWGVAIAPANWGAFGGDLLVGNFSDGKINAFDSKGNALGALQDVNGKPIALQGLWAIIFGNGKSGGDQNTLYFATGIANPNNSADTKTHGLLGAIAPPAQVLNVTNAASEASGPIAPGEIVAITGFTIGPSPLSSAVIPTTGALGTSIANTSVYFNGIAAPILYASASGTSVVVPYALAGLSTATVQVLYKGQPTANFQVAVAPTAPGLFTLDFTGGGAVVALNSDGTVNGPTNQAHRGTPVLLYATGEGQTNPAGQDGSITTGFFLHTPVASVSVTIAGLPATVVYAGSAPGSIAGVLAVEAIVPTLPAGVGAGTTGPVPIVLKIGAASSQSNATLYVQ